jgi:hypothetical protein
MLYQQCKIDKKNTINKYSYNVITDVLETKDYNAFNREKISYARSGHAISSSREF